MPFQPQGMIDPETVRNLAAEFEIDETMVRQMDRQFVRFFQKYPERFHGARAENVVQFIRKIIQQREQTKLDPLTMTCNLIRNMTRTIEQAKLESN